MQTLERTQIDEESVLELLDNMPAPSHLLATLLRLLAKDDVDARSIEDAVRQDPIIAARVIRYANSAHFGGGLEATSLNEAICAMGYATLSRFVMAKSLARMIPQKMEVYDVSAEKFYRRSLACALAMDCLCGQRDDPGGQYYTIGLMHAIGEVILDRFLAARMDMQLVFAGVTMRSLSLLERRLTGMDQAQVAAIALKKWGFPESIVEPVANQFSPTRSRKFNESAQALSTARYVARIVGDESIGHRSAGGGAHHLLYRNIALSDLVALVRKEVARFERIA